MISSKSTSGEKTWARCSVCDVWWCWRPCDDDDVIEVDQDVESRWAGQKLHSYGLDTSCEGGTRGQRKLETVLSEVGVVAEGHEDDSWYSQDRF